MAKGGKVLIGCGAGFSGDRVDAAGPVVDTLIASGQPAAIMFESLGERTVALAQLAKHAKGTGWEPLLEEMIRPILDRCLTHRIRIVGNFGGANPRGAAALLATMARELGHPQARIAVVEGDDILAAGAADPLEGIESDPATRREDLLAANVYLGAREIAAAIADGADIVVTGRVADPSLALGPIVAEFGWAWDDWDRLAAGTLAGHLLECGSQVTGGYFADPDFKDVPDPHNIGFPIAEVAEDGGFVITKAAGTGGCVTRATVTEQMLYEVHDPSAYLTPDVVLDITGVEIAEVGPDRIAVRGARGKPQPETLKATLCTEGGWIGEAEISYAGPNALARARLALDVLRRRAPEGCAWRGDIVGFASVFGDDDGRWLASYKSERLPEDLRVRVAARSHDKAVVQRATQELLALYCCGPAGGGGVRSSLRQRFSTASALIPRDRIKPRFEMLEARHG